MRRLPLALLVAAAVGFGVLVLPDLGKARFETTLPGGESFRATTVRLVDETGLVAGIREVPPMADIGQARLRFFSRAPTTPRLFWLGGACDDGLRIDFERTGDEYALWLRHEAGPFESGCTALGVARAIEVSFTRSPGAPIHVLWR
jgi:hypothetical protein